MSNTDLKALCATLLEQEAKLQFTKFTSEDALQLGLKLIENAKAYTRPVLVDITLAGHQLFHYAMQGTGPDNNEWVLRKKYVHDIYTKPTSCMIWLTIQTHNSKTVMRFRHSSFYMGRYCASQNKTLEEKYYVSEQEYAAHGGAFPLIIKDVGVVGTITVSGLAQEVTNYVVPSCSFSLFTNDIQRRTIMLWLFVLCKSILDNK